MGLCFHSTAGISIPCFWMFRKFRNLNGISLSFGQLHEQTLWANDKAGDQWAPDTTHSPRANSPVPHFHSFLPLSCLCHRGLYWHTFSTAWLHLPTSANALLSPVLPWACYLPDFCHAPMPVFSPCLFFPVVSALPLHELPFLLLCTESIKPWNSFDFTAWLHSGLKHYLLLSLTSVTTSSFETAL